MKLLKLFDDILHKTPFQDHYMYESYLKLRVKNYTIIKVLKQIEIYVIF